MSEKSPKNIAATFLDKYEVYQKSNSPEEIVVQFRELVDMIQGEGGVKLMQSINNLGKYNFLAVQFVFFQTQRNPELLIGKNHKFK